MVKTTWMRAVLLLPFVFAAQGTGQEEKRIVKVTPEETDEITLEENITYGKAGDTELKLDLARPAGNGPFPAIVFIHGGGWSGGNRQVYRAQIQEAAKRGYVAATISFDRHLKP